MSDHDADGHAETHEDHEDHGEAHEDHGEAHEDHAAEHGDHGGADAGRVTSPMQEFGSSQVTTGLVVLVVGLVVVFGIPLLL